MPEQKRQYYCSIDAVKFICALLVLANHCVPFGYSELFTIPNLIIRNYFARIAVPFFFVSSGYFYFKSNSFENYDFSKMKKYVSRLLFLYVFWCIVYFPAHIPGIIREPKGVVIGALKYLKEFVFVGGHVHLWYLNSLIVSILIVSYFIKKGFSIQKIAVIGVVLYCIGLLGQGYVFLLYPLKKIPVIWNFLGFMKWLFGTTRNGIFEGVLLLVISLVLVERRPVVSKKASLTIFIVSWLMVGVELLAMKHYIGKTENDLFIFLVPGVYYLFRYVLMIDLPPSNKYRLARKISSLLYFTHPWVRNFLLTVIRRSGRAWLLNTPLLFVSTVICCTLLSYGIVKLSDIKHFSWMKKIY